MPVASADERTTGSTTEQLLGGCPMRGNPLFLKERCQCECSQGSCAAHQHSRLGGSLENNRFALRRCIGSFA